MSMKGKKISFLAVLLAFSLGVASFQVSGAAGATREIIFGSGSATGNSKIFATALGKVISENVPGVRATGAVTPGYDAESALLTYKGTLQGGVGTPIILINATRGIPPFPKEGVKISFWFHHNDIPLNLLALASSNVTNVADLKGKKLAIAPPGTSNYIFTEVILKAHGLSVKDVRGEYMDTSEAIRKLKDAHIDAMSYVRDFSGAVLELSMARPLVLLQPSPEALPKIVKEFPWSGPLKWPFVERYPNIKVPGEGLCFMQPEAMFLASSLPDDLVYEMTKAVFEHVDEIRRCSDVYKKFNLEEALVRVSIDPHPGALRYYKEKNVSNWQKYEHLLKK
jgi:TRAP transporter TAXI family solute receptor